jgi:hypothetical protein
MAKDDSKPVSEITGGFAARIEKLAQQSRERKAAETPQEPKKMEIVPVQFPACWGEEYRAAPNALFRSALFPALRSNEKETRRFIDGEEVFSVAGLKILFTGKQFDQSDLDIYLEILNIARNFPIGTAVKFSAYQLFKSFGITDGAENYKRLHSVIVRLCGGVLDVVDHGKRYFGQLLYGGGRDDAMNYEIYINPRFAILFGFDTFSKLNIEKRRALGKNNTAKSLYGYYATHINPAAHKVETLCNIAGTKGKNRKSVIIKAHEAMKDVGILEGYTVVDDTIKADLNYSESQERAITKAAAKKTAGTRRRKLTRASDLLPH